MKDAVLQEYLEWHNMEWDRLFTNVSDPWCSIFPEHLKAYFKMKDAVLQEYLEWHNMKWDRLFTNVSDGRVNIIEVHSIYCFQVEY